MTFLSNLKLFRKKKFLKEDNATIWNPTKRQKNVIAKNILPADVIKKNNFKKLNQMQFIKNIPKYR